MLRDVFPGLNVSVHNGKPLVYLDNAATAQRPQVVIDAMNDYYQLYNANIHRGVHSLSEQATELYEQARLSMQHLIHAKSHRELIFTKGCTEGINLVAQSFVRNRVKPGDEILISHLEHHSNIVPWQMVCEQTGAELKVIPMLDSGELDLSQLNEVMSEKTKFMALVHVSNALGVINPVKSLIEKAHMLNIPVLLDGAQAAPHLPVDVQYLGCDFYTISGHKMYGPTGSGVLYGKECWLEIMPPWHGGGEMISKVTFEKTVYNSLPAKFEAGTPNISGGIGLGAAAEFILQIGIEHIAKRDRELSIYAQDKLSTVDGLVMYGSSSEKAPVFAFNLEGIHAHDVGTIVDYEGVAIRTGHHCAMPIFQYYGVSGCCRASMAFYNEESEIDHLVHALQKACKMLR